MFLYSKVVIKIYYSAKSTWTTFKHIIIKKDFLKQCNIPYTCYCETMFNAALLG